MPAEEAQVSQSSDVLGSGSKGIAPLGARDNVGETNSRLPTFVPVAIAGNFAPLLPLLLWFEPAVGALALAVVALTLGLVDILAPASPDVGAALSWSAIWTWQAPNRSAVLSPGPSRPGPVRLTLVVGFMLQHSLEKRL